MTTETLDRDLIATLDAAAHNKPPDFETCFARAFERAEVRNHPDRMLALKIELAAATILSLVGALGLGAFWRVISLIQVQPIMPFLK
jgi:hypothetical protein